MNPATILALISDLYAQLTALQQENGQLRAALLQQPEPPDEPDQHTDKENP